MDAVYELEKSNQGTLSDDSLIAIARTAEARIDAVIKIKQLALKVTNGGDWTDQGGKPYLMVSGAEKIANLFNVSWSFMTPEPLYEENEDGHYTYTFTGRFSMGGRSIEVEGSRSSKDKFFNQNDYNDVDKTKTPKAVADRDNKRDVKMSALTNLLGNGITRLLGIRNLSWEDLKEYANITKEMCGKVEYKKKGDDKPPINPPGKKSEKKEEPVATSVIVKPYDATAKEGETNGKPWTLYSIKDDQGVSYKTFDAKIKEMADLAIGGGNSLNISFVAEKNGNRITAMVIEG